MRTELRKILAVVMVLALAVSMFAFTASANDDTTVGDIVVATQDEATIDETTPDEPVVTPDEPVVTPDEPVVTPDEPVVDEPVATPDVLLYGDVNLSGKISISDATLIQKAVAELATLDELQATLADVDADGKVSVKDATEIQKYLADLPVNGLTGVVLGEEPTPEVPVVTPDEPVVTPDEPVVTPDEPVVTPDEPVVTPDEPVVTPDEPVVTPDEPVVTPDEPVVDDPIVEPEMITITFYTAKTGWVSDADAYVVLVDVDTNTAYTMTYDADNTAWTAEVPATVVNIRFDRYNPAGDTVWNAWEAGNRGDATTYQTDGNSGEWNDEIAEVEEITIYFDNSETKWDVVAFYQWSDSSFGGYNVMTQIEGTDIWSIVINSNITTGLFKGTDEGTWEDAKQTNDITVDVATNGNDILFTPVAGATKWDTTASAYEA